MRKHRTKELALKSSEIVQDGILIGPLPRTLTTLDPKDLAEAIRLLESMPDDSGHYGRKRR